MTSRVAGDPAGKHLTRDRGTGRFVPRAAAAPPSESNPDDSPVPPAVPPVPEAEPGGRPSFLRRAVTGSLGDLIRGR